MSIVRCLTRDASLIVGSSQVYSRNAAMEAVCSGAGLGHGFYESSSAVFSVSDIAALETYLWVKRYVMLRDDHWHNNRTEGQESDASP